MEPEPTDRSPAERQLSDAERRAAAVGDLTVLAALMLVGSTAFTALNLWLGTMGWIAAGLATSSTLIWSIGLLRRSPQTIAFVKVSLGLGGIAAPVIGVSGLVLGLLDYRWGWAVLGGAIVYFMFSLLGLEIIERAQNTGAVDRYEP